MPKTVITSVKKSKWANKNKVKVMWGSNIYYYTSIISFL